MQSKRSLLKFRRVTIRGAQPSARLSEEICLSEGSAGVSPRAPRGLSEGSAGSLRGSAGVRGIFPRVFGGSDPMLVTLANCWSPNGDQKAASRTLSCVLGTPKPQKLTQRDEIWADPGVLWKKAPRAMRAMRGKALETVPISTVLWVHKELPQSTVNLVLPSKREL